MWRSVICMITLSFPLISCGQDWIGVSVGGNLSSISYQNSSFEKYENLKGAAAAFFTMFTQTRVSGVPGHKSSTLLTTEFGYKSHALKDISNQSLTTWGFHYITAAIGGRYYHRSPTILNSYYGAGMVADVLLAGRQTSVFQQEDLTKSVKRVNIGIAVDAGFFYELTEDSFCTFGFGYTRGLRNVEKNRDRYTLLHSWKMSVAMILTLSQKKTGKKNHSGK
jgi:hypothetical protein